jgi:hypothetical protein
MTGINTEALEQAKLLGFFTQNGLEEYPKAFSKTFNTAYKIRLLVSETSARGIGVTHVEIADYLNMHIMTIQPLVKWLVVNNFLEQIRLGAPGCPCYVYSQGSSAIPGDTDEVKGANQPLKQFLED